IGDLLLSKRRPKQREGVKRGAAKHTRRGNQCDFAAPPVPPLASKQNAASRVDGDGGVEKGSEVDEARARIGRKRGGTTPGEQEPKRRDQRPDVGHVVEALQGPMNQLEIAQHEPEQADDAGRLVSQKRIDREEDAQMGQYQKINYQQSVY